jgi:hypothetical protein
VSTSVHEQRLNAELKMIGGGSTRFEHRADRLVRLTDDENLLLSLGVARAFF